MPSSPKILRGLDIKGWKVCYPRFEGNAALQDITNDEQVPPSSHGENGVQRREEEILQSTQDEVEKLRQQALEQAAEEIDELKKKAWEEGYAEGYKKGEQQAEELTSKAQESLEQARRERLEILAEAEPQIIQIAVSLAEKLLNYQLEFNEEVVLSLIARGLESLTQGEEVILRVNPVDEEICREKRAYIQGMLKNGASMEIKADAEIPGGSCKVTSGYTEVDLFPYKEFEVLVRKLLQLAGDVRDDIICEAEEQLHST